MYSITRIFVSRDMYLFKLCDSFSDLVICNHAFSLVVESFSEQCMMYYSFLQAWLEHALEVYVPC